MLKEEEKFVNHEPKVNDLQTFQMGLQVFDQSGRS